MAPDSSVRDFVARDQNPTTNGDNIINPQSENNDDIDTTSNPSSSACSSSSLLDMDSDYAFDDLQCLFCNHLSPDMNENLAHMSKTHGLYISMESLVVDVGDLLAYFHFIISDLYESLFCGTQRNSRQAVQQHMMAKGHCKYDIADDDAGIKDFYDPPSEPSAATKEDLLQQRQRLVDAQVLSRARLKNKRHGGHHSSTTSALPTPTSMRQSYANAELDTNAESNTTSSSNANANADAAEPSSTPPHSQGSDIEMNTRAQRQASTLNNQLARLRAGDRSSLLHLPAAQQRTVLATHRKQMAKARRVEQTQWTSLETAGNRFGCLGKIRLIRKPPHTGNVASLNR